MNSSFNLAIQITNLHDKTPRAIKSLHVQVSVRFLATSSGAAADRLSHSRRGLVAAPCRSGALVAVVLPTGRGLISALALQPRGWALRPGSVLLMDGCVVLPFELQICAK